MLLLVLLIPFALVLQTAGLLGLSIAGLFQPRGDWAIWAFLLALGLIIPVFIWSHVHQFFWGEPAPNYPKWIPSPASWGEGFFTWIVALATLVTVGLVFALYIEASCPRPYLCRYRDHEEAAGGLGAFFVVYSAYLYHWKLMAQRWWDSPARLKWFSLGKKKDPRREPKS